MLCTQWLLQISAINIVRGYLSVFIEVEYKQLSIQAKLKYIPMKKLSFLTTIVIFCFGITNFVFGQTEIIGSGTSSSTYTLITTNATPDTSVVILDDGNVGIGTSTPTTKLEVNGIIYSSNAGFKFPDFTTQVTASTGGAALYQNVFTVAQSGGDFTTITNALGACIAPSPNNAYLIRVMPGIYAESITCLKYVHLQGAGKYTTTILGSVTGADSCVIEDFNIKQGIICNSTSPTILHNIITNLADVEGHGIYVTNQGRPWILENEIIDCSHWGIYTQDFGSDPWIIANKILRNNSGGIKCKDTSPIISNNYVFDNRGYGIYLIGAIGMPSEPTIDDNVIGSSDFRSGGIGIYMVDYAEPRIIANDIYLCEYGIWINPATQPSIIGNNINYNYENGIICYSNGSSKPVVIKSNHIHSNGNSQAVAPAGIWLQGPTTPIITHNNIHNNYYNPQVSPTGSDINYYNCITASSMPMISLNIYDIIIKSSAGNSAAGQYNVTSAGATIAP